MLYTLLYKTTEKIQFYSLSYLSILHFFFSKKITDTWDIGDLLHECEILQSIDVDK